MFDEWMVMWKATTFFLWSFFLLWVLRWKLCVAVGLYFMNRFVFHFLLLFLVWNNMVGFSAQHFRFPFHLWWFFSLLISSESKSNRQKTVFLSCCVFLSDLWWKITWSLIDILWKHCWLSHLTFFFSFCRISTGN